MYVSKVEVFKARIKLRRPFRIALGEHTVVEDYIIRIETKDGLVGYGEASPSKAILGDDLTSTLETLKLLAKRLIGIDPTGYERWRDLLRGKDLSSSARAALDIALSDLIAKHYGVPLYKLLGDAKTKIETDYTIGIKSPEEASKEAAELARKGFRIIKVKLGEGKEADIQRVRSVREAVGPKVRIRVDANQGWDFETAREIIREIAKYDIELVEQPLKHYDLKGLAKLKRLSPIPIMLDESVHTAEDAIYAIRMDAADVINIKLMKSGGLWEAVRIAHVAEAADIPCMVGCMSEAEVGIIAGIHFACGLSNVVFADLDADLMMTEHVVSANTLDVPYRVPPSEPGLGFNEDQVNYDILEKVLEVK